jgi:hypothetical protein
MLRFLKSLPLLVNRNPWQKSQIIVIFLSQYRNIVCENVWCDEGLRQKRLKQERLQKNRGSQILPNIKGRLAKACEKMNWLM